MRRVGVLLVHGIGTQVRGRTLVDWGGAIASWITRWRAPSRPDRPSAAHLSDAVLSPDANEPPRVTLSVDDGEVLLAESWWADTVLQPTYVELLRWAFVIVPWTITSHFLTRLRTSGGGVATLWTFVALLVAMLAMPLLLTLLTVILILGLIPIPQVRAVAGALQRALAATIGDSLVLLNNDVQRSAIVSRVRRDLTWLSKQGDLELVVVAHSQGAAIAYEALRGSDAKNVTLVTFGAGIAKLLESEWLLQRSGFARWAPWLFSAGGALLAVGLWRALPALWQPSMRERVLWAAVIFVAGIGILAAIQSRIPKWLAATLSLLTAAPIIPIVWMWLDETPWAFLLLGAQWAIMLGFHFVTREERPRPEPLLNVTRWLDLYASHDPVSNGPLFDPPPSGDVYGWIDADGNQPAPVSVEVWNQRSGLSDHTSYWMSVDDFIPKIAWVVASRLGVKLGAAHPAKAARLQCAARRRQWRTAWLAIARTGLLLGTFFILMGQGLTHDLSTLRPNDNTPHPLMTAQRSATIGAIEMVGGLTPEFVQRRLVVPPATFANGPGVVRGASLLLLLLALGSASLLIEWRWRVWDRTEVSRLFDGEDVAVLEPQFIAFLLMMAAVFEVIALAAAGWIAPLRAASRAELVAMASLTAVFAVAGAWPWVMRTILFMIWDFSLRTVRRALCAAALTCLIVIPVLAGDPPTFLPTQTAFDAFKMLWGQRPYLGVIILAIWVIPQTGVWRRLEPLFIRLSHVQPPGVQPAASTAGRGLAV